MMAEPFVPVTDFFDKLKRLMPNRVFVGRRGD
jgi:hypothetical protein